MNTSKPIRIALVDDHVLVRDGVKALLGAIAHFDVIGQAESGEQALELVASTELDILLVDVGLQGMNGLELTQRLRSLYPDIRILM